MLYPLDRFEWERVVRRVNMHPTCKLVAFALASYANRHGANAHPGNARLAEDCGVTVRTVERHMQWLRDSGLIDRTFRGSSAGRSKFADTYQLVQADDMPARGVTFNRTPDTDDGSSVETPDTRDGCSPVENAGSPDTHVGSSEPDHPTSGEEHPTPVTGTPDIWSGSPDTHVGPSSTYIKQDHQEELHHAEASASAHTHASDDLTDQPANSTDKDQFEIELEALRALKPERLQHYLDAATNDAEGAPWPDIVHLAYQRSRQEAMAS